MTYVLVAVTAVLVVVLGSGVLLLKRRAPTTLNESSTSGAQIATPDRPTLPEAGVLMAESVLPGGGSQVSIWHALDNAAVPVAVSYRPVSSTELARYKAVPLNAGAQDVIKGLTKLVNPKDPTLYEVVLPKGAELVKAVGQAGFRGFARNAKGIKAQAVLVPAGAAAAAGISWPAVALAGTVMTLDMAMQAEQRENQKRLFALMDRAEEHRYKDRIAAHRTADQMLSHAVAVMRDGRNPHLEVTRKAAYDVFHNAALFLEANRDLLDGIIDDEGKADFRTLEKRIGGDLRTTEHFFRELQLAREAISIRRRSLIVDAAAHALEDPTNPYEALQELLSAHVADLERAEAISESLTTQLTTLRMKGRWYDSDKAVGLHEIQVHNLAAPPTPAVDVEPVRILVTPDGEIQQLIPIEGTAEGDGDVVDAEIVETPDASATIPTAVPADTDPPTEPMESLPTID